MAGFTSTLKFVLLLAGASMVIAGLGAMAVGGVTLAQDNDPVQLTVASGPEVAIPAASGVLGGSVTVYTTARATDSPTMLGCELVEDDGELASGTRIGDFDFALGDPVTARGATWYPFTEIELESQPATLRCSGDILSSAAVSEQSTFGRSSTFIGGFALGSGLLALVLGIVALLAGWKIRR